MPKRLCQLFDHEALTELLLVTVCYMPTPCCFDVVKCLQVQPSWQLTATAAMCTA